MRTDSRANINYKIRYRTGKNQFMRKNDSFRSQMAMNSEEGAPMGTSILTCGEGRKDRRIQEIR